MHAVHPTRTQLHVLAAAKVGAAQPAQPLPSAAAAAAAALSCQTRHPEFRPANRGFSRILPIPIPHRFPVFELFLELISE